MPIQRYLHSGPGEPFGTGSQTESNLYRCYSGGGMVGLAVKLDNGNRKAPPGFTYGLLTWGDVLVVRRTPSTVDLWRDCFPAGVLSAQNGGSKAVADLAGLLERCETLHLFETCHHDGGVTDILTFSAVSPVNGNYLKVKPMQVVMQ